MGTIRRALAFAALLLGCRSGAAHDAAPTLRFDAAPGSPHAVGRDAGRPRLVDVNGDGQLDAVVTCAGEGERSGFVHVLLGDGRGGLRPAGPPLAIGLGGVKADAGDMDDDGRVDLVVGAHDRYEVDVWLQDASGRFPVERKRSFAARAGSKPHTHSVVVADVNGDARLDVLTTNADDGTISVLLGNGAGGLRAASGSPVAAGRHPYEGLTVVDLDGDGRPDLVAPDLEGRSVTALLGDGRGGFRPAPGSPIAVSERPGVLTTGDVDGDGRPDVVVTHDDDPIVAVLRNAGGGRLAHAPGSPLRLAETVWGAAVADVTGDGRADVVLGAKVAHVLVIVGDGSGRFAEPVRVPVGGRGPGNVAVGDLDRDGRPDIVTGDYDSGTVSVLLRR